MIACQNKIFENIGCMLRALFDS